MNRQSGIIFTVSILLLLSGCSGIAPPPETPIKNTVTPVPVPTDTPTPEPTRVQQGVSSGEGYADFCASNPGVCSTNTTGEIVERCASDAPICQT